MKKTCPVSLTALACFVVFALTGLFAFDAQQRASTTVHEDTELVGPTAQELREAAISARRAKAVVDARVEAQLDALASQLGNQVNMLDDASLWINGEQELDMVEIEALHEQLRDLSTDVSLLDFTLGVLPAVNDLDRLHAEERRPAAFEADPRFAPPVGGPPSVPCSQLSQ